MAYTVKSLVVFKFCFVFIVKRIKRQVFTCFFENTS